MADVWKKKNGEGWRVILIGFMGLPFELIMVLMGNDD
jgi:hypothetical protein